MTEEELEDNEGKLNPTSILATTPGEISCGENISCWGEEITALDLRYSITATVLLCVAYFVVFVVGVLGNALVVNVVLRCPGMRSPTNLFIANLACADLLVNIICLPFTLISSLTTGWLMGWLVCKTIPYLQGVSVNASINTLVAISVERCLSVCRPMKSKISSRTVRAVLILIWTFSMTITLPWAVFFQLRPLEGSPILTCLETWPSTYSENIYFVVANLFMCYLLPLSVISICYVLIWRRVCDRRLPGEHHITTNKIIQKSKVKVIKMLFCVIVLFAGSWLPLYAIITRLKLGGPLEPLGIEETFIHSLLPMAQWLGASNSCINPILYGVLNNKFRAGFKAVLASKSCCSPLPGRALAPKFPARRTFAAMQRPVQQVPPTSRSLSLSLDKKPPAIIDFKRTCNGTFV